MISLDNITKFCKEKSLVFSVINADKLDFEASKLENIPFVNYTIEERLDPKLTKENTKSIIMIGVPYYKNKINHFDTDYHILVKNLLEELTTNISGDCECFVDTGALFERGFAVKSGLGFKGYNTSVINEKQGSYFNIGYILTTEEFQPTKEINHNCIGCNKCINNCPTKSLYKENESYSCNYTRCISYLTQKKGILTINEMKSMGTSLYGCEICQQVCPHNKEVEFSKTSIEATPIEILKATKKSFLQYKDLPFYWRGLPTIKRNALISVFNSSLTKEEKIEIISEFKNSENDTLRETAKILIDVIKI